MYLTGLTHRDELFDLTVRWLNDDFHCDDVRIISEIFLYEGFISATVIADRMFHFLQKIFGDLRTERIRNKHRFRECLIRHVPHRNRRIEELENNFHENPDFFFPRLRIDATLFLNYEARLVSIGRIKRLTRVAEKTSYRLIDALFREITAEAERLAANRAVMSGMPLSSFISSEEDMRQDFIEAEIAVVNRFRQKAVRLKKEALTINDIVGFKIIGEQDELDSLLTQLRRESGIAVIESETHSGNYNAVNVLVEIELPGAGELVDASRRFDWSISARRGLDPDEAKRHFPAYLEQGSRTIRMEIILTGYPELMESEFGKSLHESRILRLRERRAYSGLIAQNAGYLIEYLLTLAMAPVVNVPELPIKMYGRYLPETISAVKSALFGNDLDESLIDAFYLGA